MHSSKMLSHTIYFKLVDNRCWLILLLVIATKPNGLQGKARCPDGSQSAGSCIGGLCAIGFQCIVASNRCCQGGITPEITGFTCPTNGLPSYERCLPSLLCPTASNICVDGVNCCPNPSTNTNVMCADGSVSIGDCVGGLCPVDFVCNVNRRCCNAAFTCPTTNLPSTERCTGLTCPTRSLICVDGVNCCPNPNSNQNQFGKALGEQCSSRQECRTNSADCVSQSNGRKVCACSRILYKYGSQCVANCPRGTVADRRRMECR